MNKKAVKTGIVCGILLGTTMISVFLQHRRKVSFLSGSLKFEKHIWQADIFDGVILLAGFHAKGTR